jgi:GNAT superfamily N-acetyltransferase
MTPSGRGRPSLFLEDLFVRPAHRGKKAGIALMRRLAQVALANECRRFVWQVLDWNEPAIRFYESLGAKVLREWLTVRLDGEALAKLAEGDSGA